MKLFRSFKIVVSVGAMLLLSSCVISEDSNFNYIRARNKQKVVQNSEQSEGNSAENSSEHQNKDENGKTDPVKIFVNCMYKRFMTTYVFFQ